MNRIRRAMVAGASAAAIATVGLAAPASAQTAPIGDLYCTYQLDNKLHKVSGGCTGHSEFGSASGSFDGTYRPNGSAKGKFRLDSRKGSFQGSFQGWSFDGGHANGTFAVSLGALRVTGGFVASVG